MNLSILSFESKFLLPEDKKNILLDWQTPVITEKAVFENVKNKIINLPYLYIGYPWATLMDYYNGYSKNKYSFEEFLKLNDLWLDLENGITVVQSYHFKKFLKDFQKMGIKYIFSPHIEKSDFNQIFQQYNIYVYPIYIYPVNSCDNISEVKDLFYSFIGTTKYNLEYPTKIRTKLVKMDHPENTIIVGLDQWHFNSEVFSKQLKLIDFYHNDFKNNEENYKSVLKRSRFNLCPLGVGPNSIRIWESLSYGSIPVIIADKLWLPEIPDVNYHDFMVFIKESELDQLTNILKYINPEREFLMREKGISYYNKYIKSNFGKIIENYFEKSNSYYLLMPWYNSKNKQRIKELNYCLERNIENDNIKEIVLFYELLLNEKVDMSLFSKSKVRVIFCRVNNCRRISFNMLADWANNNLFNKNVIISNNDIFYDDSIKRLNELDLHKQFVSLTRTNYEKYEGYNGLWEPHSASQDSWIFRTPLKLLEEDIYLGWIQCDNIISYYYDKMNYQVVNPQKSVKAWHVHLENNTLNMRNIYDYTNTHPIKFVSLLSIEEINSDNLKYIRMSDNDRNNYEKLIDDFEIPLSDEDRRAFDLMTKYKKHYSGFSVLKKMKSEINQVL